MQKLIAGALIATLAFVAHAHASTLISVADRRDVIFDSTRNFLYITTDSGKVQRFNLSTGLLLSPFTVGGNLRGGDMTPNGQFLYVADAVTVGTQAIIRKVNLNTGATVNVVYTKETNEAGAWDVVVMNNGFAFTTGEFAGSGWVPLRQLNLATDTFTIRLTDVRQRTHLHRSSDRGTFIGLESNISSGPVFDYDAPTDSLPDRRNFGISLSSAVAGTSSNGDYFALNSSILNSDLSLHNSMPYSVGGLVFDPLRNLIYVADYNTDQIIGYDFLNQLELFRLPIGENISASGSFSPTEMTISDNTQYIFLETPGGVRLFDNPVAVPEPATWVLAILGLAGMTCVRLRRGRALRA